MEYLVLYFVNFIIFAKSLEVRINMDSPHATVEKEFLSVTLDGGWQTSNFSYSRMETLLRGLSPAYLRLGGGSADHRIFSNQPAAVFTKSGVTPSLHAFNTTEIDRKVGLVRAVGFKLLLDLDLQLRYGTQWDPTNTVNLLGYLHKQKYHDVLNFELGNEPDLYNIEGPYVVKLNGTRIGEDFTILHKLLTQYNFTKCTTVGPDSALVRSDTGLFYQFLQEAGKFLTAATFHHYYLNGRIANVSDFIDIKVFDSFPEKITHAKNIIKSTKTPSLPLWIGEAADAYGGGARNISDTYVSGFLWLDKLGVSAREGIGVVMRQAFHGGNYGLISGATPTTNYWLSHVHKQLTGQVVLNVTTGNTKYDSDLFLKKLWNFFRSRIHKNPHQIRIYAHCTKASSKYKSGSITIFALNLEKSGSETLTFPATLSSQMVDIYLLTPTGPGRLQAKQIALNGKTLEMIDDHTLPPLVPVQQSASQGIKLPALTFGFFVFPDANAAACK